jgi:excisionase family DNA binding protein
MSSNINVVRICEFCKNEFDARTTTTRYCSHKCNSRGYKQNVKELKIKLSNRETLTKSVVPYEILNSKPYLSISESCKLIGISRSTIYRLIQHDKIITYKIGSRTIIRNIDINNLINNNKK